MAKFKPGVSGNPAGKPKGAVSAATKLRQAIAADLPEIVDVLRQQALAGDVGAARLLLERALPPLRAEAAPAAVTPTAPGLGERAEAVVTAALAGALSPTTATELMGVLGQHARIAETTDLEQRLADLEAQLEAQHAVRP